ncbi:ATP-binding protein [Kribbella ginsengisoli]|uniref:ATP-binding protein n=1 Tax=Kribbella ginsengisoli TaxID=363865 RepID=A0ABP6YG09_9ACTN
MTAGLSYLLGRLALVEERVRALVALRKPLDPAPNDAFRGLFLTPAAVESLLAGRPVGVPDELAGKLAEVEAAGDAMEADGTTPRLRGLIRSFGLTDLDVEILLIAVAPDLDARFEQLYGYLNDDVSRRRATPRLALDLLAIPSADAGARARFDISAPLIAGGLIELEDPARPFLTRAIRVPDQVTAYLIGGYATEPALHDLVLPSPLVVYSELENSTEQLIRVLRPGQPVYLREKPGSAAKGLAATAFAKLGLGVLSLDLARLPADVDAVSFARTTARHARLRSAGVLAAPVESIRPDVLRALTVAPVPVVLIGTPTWDPSWSAVVPAVLDAPSLTASQSATLWHAMLPPESTTSDLDAAAETATFRLDVDQIARTAEAAGTRAALDGVLVNGEILRAGARSQNGAGLERLSRRIIPAVSWEDLVLPDDQLDRLRELAIRARHREQVIRGWGMRPGGGRGAGVSALFTGESGTGKTLSAEVIARELGVDLYVVDLATVIDKYIGETEKNLERIFTEATGVNGVLLFDEADAIFGKRSDVQDARDRYANVEVAYLLQRMESFDGLAILTTNLRANLDDAFSRRLDMVVHFAQPDEDQRLLLWDRCLGNAVPRDPSLDLSVLAGAFDLAGGDIRSAVVTAAYYAAAAGRAVTMADLITAVDHEYTKLGRLPPSPGVR